METNITEARKASRQYARKCIVFTLSGVKRRHSLRGATMATAGVSYVTACWAAHTGGDDNGGDYMRRRKIGQPHLSPPRAEIPQSQAVRYYEYAEKGHRRGGEYWVEQNAADPARKTTSFLSVASF